MNKQFILSNLAEAKEELEATIQAIQTQDGYDFADFHVAMAHTYHQMNSAWNGRNISDAEWIEYSDESFTQLERYPTDLPLIGQEAFYDLPEYQEGDEGGSPDAP